MSVKEAESIMGEGSGTRPNRGNIHELETGLETVSDRGQGNVIVTGKDPGNEIVTEIVGDMIGIGTTGITHHKIYHKIFTTKSF